MTDKKTWAEVDQDAERERLAAQRAKGLAILFNTTIPSTKESRAALDAYRGLVAYEESR